MPIKFRCPHCEQFLGISDSKAGSITDCPMCGRSLRVPGLDGTVAALPAPQLNLQDEQLRAALGALAALHEPESSTRPTPSTTASLLPRPEPIVTSQQTPHKLESPSRLPAAQLVVPQAEVVTSQRFIEAETITAATPHAEVISEFSQADLALLEQLCQQPPASGFPPIAARSAVKNLRYQFSPGMVLSACGISLLCGLLIGLAVGRMSERPADPTVQPAGAEQLQAAVELAPVPAVPVVFPEVHGVVTYSGATADAKPDDGARILILPLQRPGVAKLSHAGFRVGADETSRQLLATAAEVFGGDFELADSQGHFRVAVTHPGRYGLLVASKYQSRAESIPITENCQTFLARYFDRPELVIGNVEYQFFELNLDNATPVKRDIQFAAH